MAFLDDVQVGTTPTPSSGAKPTLTPSGGGNGFLSDLSVGHATATPSAKAAVATTTPVPSRGASIPLAKPVPTANLFSKFVGFAGSALGKTSDAISKFTSAPDPSTLGTNATANTLKYLPSELARAIPGVADLQDNPEVTQYMEAKDIPKNVGTALGDTAAGIIKSPITAVADVYDAGRQILGKKPNASFNIPVLGKVTSNQFNAVERIRNGEDPVVVSLSEGGNAIFNTLFFADVINRVAGPRAVKTAEVTGNVEDTPLTPEAGPKTGRLYEEPASYSKGGAQVLPPEVIEKMKAQGVELGPKFDPNSPTFFRVVQNGAKYRGEVMQLKPSYIETAFRSVFGKDGPPTTLPELLNGPEAGAPHGGLTPEQLSKIGQDAKPGDVTVLHEQTVDPADIKDAINEHLYHGANSETAASIRANGFQGSEDFPGHGMVSLTKDAGEAGDYATLGGKSGEVMQVKITGSKIKTYNSMEDYTNAIENAPGDSAGEREASLNAPYDAVRIKVPGQEDAIFGNPKSLSLVGPKASPVPAAPTAAPALGVTMAHTVSHNMLRLGNGDTSRAVEGAKVLQGEIKSHIKTHGEPVTHQALQDKLGVDGETAARLIAESKPPPALTAPSIPSTFLTDTDIAHGPVEGVDLKQPTKLSNEVAAPLAATAADTHWREVQEHAIEDGKPLIVGGDNLKDFFGKDYNDNNHPVYSQAAFLQYEHALKTSPVKEVVFTGGGPASGKTELITKDLTNRGFKGVIYDSNLSNLAGIIKQIEMARAAGFKVVIKGVLPHLDSARTFSILRGNEIGRHISDNTFARGHAGFPNVARELLEKGIISEEDMHILDMRETMTFQDAMRMVHGQEYMKEPLAILRKLDYNEEDFKQLYGKDKFDATTGHRLEPLQSGGGTSEALGEGGTDKENAIAEGDERILGLTPDQLQVTHHTVPQPMRGFINPYEIADDITDATKQVKEYVEQSVKTTELTGTVTDAIYQHEGARKAMRQRAIQLLQTRGKDLSAEQWEKLYHFDENPDEKLTAEEKKVYDEVIAPLKDALTKARAEYRELGGVITADLSHEMTPRYAKEKGGPIDKLLNQAQEVAKGAKTLYNGGLISKSVGSGAKGRVFHALIDSKGNRIVVSIPNAKASRVTAFKNGVLTDLGPKSGKDGAVFTDENGKEYKISQATTKEIEAHTKTRYHKNVLANYVLAFDRTNNAIGALKLLNRIEKTPEFADLIVKETPETAPPAKWKDLSGVLPQFRGYYAEPKLWEALKDLASRLQGREPFPVIDEINNFLTAMIVINPIMHMPNVAQNWLAASAATGKGIGFTKKSRQNLATAVNEVKNKGPLYLTYLEHGAPFMAIKGTAQEFTKAVLTQYTEEVAENPKENEALAKALGYANPAEWMKAFGHLNETITWGGSDIAFIHALLDWADANGSTPEAAIKEVSKRMADYRIPSRMGPGQFGRAVSLLFQSRAFLFSRFHYSGVIKPWIETMKDAADPRSTTKQRLAGLRVMAYLALMSLIIYPYINKLLRGITGDPKTYISMAGSTKLVQNVEKLADVGVTGIPAFGQATLTLSPAMTAAIELGLNVDLYTRNPIYGNPPAQGMSEFGVSMVSPLSSSSRMSGSDFALSLLGIYTPKNTDGKRALQTQKYDEMPALQVEIKKLIVEGNQKKADALIVEFNQRAIVNYNRNALATGGKPLTADGSEDQAFLKEWGIKEPGTKALLNAQALYVDGSLTSKQSLLDTVSTYAKAVGADPATAFERIFTGQRITRVANFGFFSPTSTILVERMPLAASELVKRDKGAVEGQVLDHVIPLEAGGSNDTSNLNLIPAANNVGEQHLFENMLGDAVKAGVITQAQVREYAIRYKVGQGETLPQAYMDEFKNKYGGKTLTIEEVHQLILDNKKK